MPDIGRRTKSIRTRLRLAAPDLGERVPGTAGTGRGWTGEDTGGPRRTQVDSRGRKWTDDGTLEETHDGNARSRTGVIGVIGVIGVSG
ncbi:MAG TPA: hypothetical protein PK072_02280, partial [Quisquiliibacterium sp.]|nr:hypothetical protein [Quisquiliibacterium sp.]